MIGEGGHDALVARETAIGIVINGVISAIVFLLLFGHGGTVPVAGLHGLAADFIPQALMVALMSSLVPAILTRRRVGRGVLAARAGAVAWPLAVRVPLVGITTMIVAGGGAWLICLRAAPPTMGWLAALAIKIAFGGAVALIVTPSAVRDALLPRRGRTAANGRRASPGRHPLLRDLP